MFLLLIYLASGNLLEQWKSLPVFVVGKATAKAGSNELLLLPFVYLMCAIVNQLGLNVKGEISGKASNLADIVIKSDLCIFKHTRVNCNFIFYVAFSTTDKAHLKPLLFPCGNLKREELPLLLHTAGIPLHTVTCYQTLPHPDCTKSINEITTLVSYLFFR